MDFQEKIVELLAPTSLNFEEAVYLADYLVKNGVTLQEWIPANDRLPNEPMRCLVYTKRGKYWGYEITYYNQGFYTQYAEAIYWMPLPQPPKGE